MVNGKLYEFRFKYDGYVYEKTLNSDTFEVNGDSLPDKDFSDWLSLLRGFVKSALEGKPLHITVL